MSLLPRVRKICGTFAWGFLISGTALAAEARLNRTFDDTLLSRISALEKGPAFSKCDRDRFESMKAIAGTLDDRAALIVAYNQTHRESADKISQPLGPISIDAPKPGVITKKNPAGWLKNTYSWQNPINAYAALPHEADIATTSQIAAWSKIDADVRSILFDDENRTQSLRSFSLAPDSELKIPAVLNAVYKCIKQPLCTFPELHPELTKWLDSQPGYASALLGIRSKLGRSTPDLQALYKKLEADRAQFLMIPNRTVRREGNQLILPLVAGEFENVKSEVAAIVESVWKSEKLSLRIEWHSEVQPPGFKQPIYVLKFDQFAERPRVSFQERTVTLINGMDRYGIPHEIGHVLGFRDRYYTVWNPESCAYDSYWREDDLMSDSPESVVTDEEWKLLSLQYPEITPN